MAMALQKKFRWGAFGVVALFCVAALGLWMTPSRQTSSAQDGPRAGGPLISRGYTDAPGGTVSIAGNMAVGGGVLVELRVSEGQTVKRDEVVGVLSNYAISDVSVRSAEAELERAKLQRKAMTSGYRTSEIAMQEVAVKAKIDENKLKALEIARSGRPPEMKQLDLSISQYELDREEAKLRVMKETLQTDLAQIDTDIGIIMAKVDSARTTREQSLIRSPLDGIIVQIFTRPGERVAVGGVVKIVDMSRLRVLAEVDELHLGRVALGGKVEVTFRGSNSIYRGKISRVAPTVKRMQRTEPDGGPSTDARVVQVEVELDDAAGMPQVLGRETRVTFP